MTPHAARTARTARTAWDGDLEGGSGQVQMTSSGVGTYPVTFYARTAEEAGGTTSPEELLAAAYTSSYAMQLSALVAQAGATPEHLDVAAEVVLGPDPAGGFALTGLELTVRGRASGLDADGFTQAAHAARERCPLGKALTRVEISVGAALGDAR